jgi:hypothetical protein
MPRSAPSRIAPVRLAGALDPPLPDAGGHPTSRAVAR